MSELLKNCPFCGSDNVGLDIEDSQYFSILCCYCCFSSPKFFDENGAIKYWNTRHSPWISVKVKQPEEKRLLVFLTSYDKIEFVPMFGYYRHDFLGFIPMCENHRGEDSRICFKSEYYNYLPELPKE